MLTRLFCILLLLPVFPAHANEPGEFAEAREVFLRAVDGDRRAVRDATLRFRTLSAAHPQEAVFIAYLGACTTLQGRDGTNNIERRRLTEEGLREIDRALALAVGAEQDPVRYLDAALVAANSYIHVPSFFNRYDDARRLVREILAHPGFERMADAYRAAAYMAAALLAQGDRDEEAYVQYLRLSVEADPEGRDGRLASGLLAEG
ncbi:MAG: hypothetical protein RBT81_13195 [Gammaproteobacteria bacterium]|jgi:hypothetical protein|nr:hypothetical protein [Gammaproteobacteria bacterium]